MLPVKKKRPEEQMLPESLPEMDHFVRGPLYVLRKPVVRINI